MEKQYVIDAITARDSWRLFHIMAEFVEGFDLLSDVGSAVTIFGSARAKEGDPLYTRTYELAKVLARNKFNIITGGGPGVMEAANKGAQEVGVKSIGINIQLPLEQKPNPYINVQLSCKYFFIRKVMFIKYAIAYIVMPGGFGTLDEFFEAVTLIQTKKIKPFPVILVDSAFWQPVVRYMEKTMVATGMINKEEMDIFKVMDDPQEVAEYIKKFVIV